MNHLGDCYSHPGVRRGVGSDLAGSVEAKDIMFCFEGQVIGALHRLEVGVIGIEDDLTPLEGARRRLRGGADGRKRRPCVWLGHPTCPVGCPHGRGERQAGLSAGEAKGSLFGYDFCSRH